MALDLTVHFDGPELSLDEELEGGGKVVIGLPLQAVSPKYTFFINGPGSYRPHRWS
jgi:hypothetical protein